MSMEPFIQNNRTVPNGQIMVWSGKLSNIPNGWVLCDGNNGSPDLRGRFLKSVPNSSSNPGVGGGQDSFTLATGQLPSHTHSGSTSTDGSHVHNMNYVQGDSGADTYDNAASGGSYHSLSSSKDGAHSHSLSVGNTGSGNSIENRPAFYEVAYIMRL